MANRIVAVMTTPYEEYKLIADNLLSCIILDEHIEVVSNGLDEPGTNQQKHLNIC